VGKKEKRLQSNQKGFSMVEVLVALSLVSMLISVIYVIIINSTSLNAQTTLRAEAGSLAFKKIQDYINLGYDNIPIGDDAFSYEVEDFSAEAETARLANAQAKVYIEPESILTTATVTDTTNFTQTIAADAAFVSGSEINSVNEHDATGDYWQSRRIRDDNYTNYTYSAYAWNPNNMASPSIDLGSSQVVDTIRVNWYYCGYGADNFRIEAKNNSPNSNSGWTTIVSGLSDNGIPCSTGNNSQDIDVSSNTTPYRHWRLYIIDAEDEDLNVFSELEAFSAGVPGDIVEQQGADASDNPGELYFSSSDLELSEDGSRGQQSIGIIFDDVNVTQAATIDSAYIQFTSDEADSTPVNLLVTGVDRDTAQPWNGSFAVDNAVDNDGSDGSQGTTASTAWTPPSWSAGESGEDTRVDVTAIVQEIVDRVGWSAANDMAFAVQYVSGAGQRVAERDPSPQLVINWSQSTTTTSTGPFEDTDGDGDVDNPTLLRATAVIEYDSQGRRQRVEYATFIRKFGVSD
jgi:prepilin-type N-terminal cleavage/methylation domain-containing protein